MEVIRKKFHSYLVNFIVLKSSNIAAFFSFFFYAKLADMRLLGPVANDLTANDICSFKACENNAESYSSLEGI